MTTNEAAIGVDADKGVGVRLASFFGHKPVIFCYNLLVLLVLSSLLVGYFEAGIKDFFPQELRGLPLYAVWFGALGGVVYSMKWVYTPGPEGEGTWYYGRPFSGAVVGGMVFVLLLALTPGSTPSAPLVEAAAFVVGIQEKRFFDLLFRVADVVLSVPESQEVTRANIQTQTSSPNTLADQAGHLP